MGASIDVMVDLETTGTDPSHSAILQISAVRFDIHDKTIDTSCMFDRCLRMAPGRFWDEGTRDWWMNQNQEVLRSIYERMEDPAVVIRDFWEWACKIQTLTPVRLWAKPITFEYPFLSSYFRQFDLLMPFHYRESMDLNTFIRTKGHWNVNAYWKQIEFQGDAHNALHDVLHQIKGALLVDDINENAPKPERAEEVASV